MSVYDFVAPSPKSAGCGKPSTLKNGVNTAGREYTLRLPNNYDYNKPYMLIMCIHWLGGNMQSVVQDNYYNLISQSNNSAILVSPQGAGADGGWGNGQSDLVFFDNMLKQLEDNLCIDTRKIFATGFNYGGGMTFALACARPDVYRAVFIIAGGVVSGCSGGTKPIGYAQIHGINDTVFPIAQSASLMRDKFAKNNGCTAQSVSNVATGSGTHKCTSYEGCKEGYPTMWCSFDGGHTQAPTDRTGDRWAPAETWKFFTQFN